jgi:hypothetical protein
MMVSGNEVIHVAAAPPAALDEELVKKIAAIIGKNPYETRLRLAGKVPKIIANYDMVALAKSAAESLRALGLVVTVVSDSVLRRPWQMFKARSLKFEEQAITFYDRAGQPNMMEAGELFLILSARMQHETQTEVTKTVRKLNVAATLLTGGIPITKKVKQKEISKSYQNVSFLRLYSKTLPETVVEIQQQNFDYSFLGSEMASSASANYAIAVRKIRESFPRAIFDDSLMELFGTNMTATVSQDTIETNCKLIYWYHLAVSNTSTSLQIRPGQVRVDAPRYP